MSRRCEDPGGASQNESRCENALRPLVRLLLPSPDPLGRERCPSPARTEGRFGPGFRLSLSVGAALRHLSPGRGNQDTLLFRAAPDISSSQRREEPTHCALLPSAASSSLPGSQARRRADLQPTTPPNTREHRLRTGDGLGTLPHVSATRHLAPPRHHHCGFPPLACTPCSPPCSPHLAAAAPTAQPALDASCLPSLASPPRLAGITRPIHPAHWPTPRQDVRRQHQRLARPRPCTTRCRASCRRSLRPSACARRSLLRIRARAGRFDQRSSTAGPPGPRSVGASGTGGTSRDPRSMPVRSTQSGSSTACRGPGASAAWCGIHAARRLVFRPGMTPA